MNLSRLPVVSLFSDDSAAFVDSKMAPSIASFMLVKG